MFLFLLRAYVLPLDCLKVKQNSIQMYANLKFCSLVSKSSEQLMYPKIEFCYILCNSLINGNAYKDNDAM